MIGISSTHCCRLTSKPWHGVMLAIVFHIKITEPRIHTFVVSFKRIGSIILCFVNGCVLFYKVKSFSML